MDLLFSVFKPSKFQREYLPLEDLIVTLIDAQKLNLIKVHRKHKNLRLPLLYESNHLIREGIDKTKLGLPVTQAKLISWRPSASMVRLCLFMGIRICPSGA